LSKEVQSAKLDSTLFERKLNRDTALGLAYCKCWNVS